MRQSGLDVPAVPEIYVPLDQVVVPFMWPHNSSCAPSGDPLALAPAVRAAIWDVDPSQPVSNVRAMSEVLDAELANRNTQLTLIGAFAVLALAARGRRPLRHAELHGLAEHERDRAAHGARRRAEHRRRLRRALGARRPHCSASASVSSRRSR